MTFDRRTTPEILEVRHSPSVFPDLSKPLTLGFAKAWDAGKEKIHIHRRLQFLLSIIAGYRGTFEIPQTSAVHRLTSLALEERNGY